MGPGYLRDRLSLSPHPTAEKTCYRSYNCNLAGQIISNHKSEEHLIGSWVALY